MNEKSKIRMLQQKTLIVDGLKTHFPTIPMFEDEIAEDEEKAFIDSKYHTFVLMMGDFIPNETNTLRQSIFVDYYSEERDDVDEMIVDIISIIEQIPTVSFVRTSKLRARAADTDRFVDVVTIEFRRLVKYEGRN